MSDLSLKAIRWAFQRHMNDATAKAVLVALAEHVEDGRADCWPSAKRLGKYTALGERTVRAVVSRLAKMRAIAVEERDGTSPVCTLNFEWEGETEPRRATPRSRIIKRRQTPASDAAPTPVSHADLPRRQTAATPASRAQTPASDADEPYRTPYEPKRGEEEFSEVPESENDDDVAEDHDGSVAVLTRPPSADRSRGAHTAGDVLAKFMRSTGPPVKQLKNQRIADVHIANWLMTNGGMDSGKAWDLVTTARTLDHPDQIDSSRFLEKLSRQHRLGWFAEETV